MAGNESKLGRIASSCQRLEAAVAAQGRGSSDCSPDALCELVRELRAHQADLESQNSALRVAQDELLASRADYREMFDAAPDALFVYEAVSGKTLDANAAACRLFGITPEEARGMQVPAFSSGEPGYTREDADRQLARAIRKGENVFRWRAKKKSGEIFCAEIGLRCVTIAGRARVLVVVRDLTERLQAEETLRREHAFAESLIETAQAIVLVLDPAGRIVRFNRYMEELTGYRLAEVKGKVWFDAFLPESDRQRIRDVFAQAVGNVQTRGNVNPIVTKDGRKRLIEWYDKALKDAEGNVVGLVAVGQDITERKQAEEALQRAHDELERRVAERTRELVAVNTRLREEIAERQRIEEHERQLEADLAHVGRLTTMGEMASSLAHELNQPLAAIALQSEVVLRIARDGARAIPGELLKSLDLITKQAHRAGELTRRMREFVRRTAPKRVVVTVAEVIDEVLPLIQRDLRHSSVALEVKADDPRVQVLADKVQLQQVLLNLIRNAIEAMEPTEVGQRHLCIERRVRGPVVEVAVRDTGCGIRADDARNANKLFNMFYSTKAEGMGMGLAICRSIVESHGGRIWAAPNPDRGTTFTFTLPIASEGRENETETPCVRRR